MTSSYETPASSSTRPLAESIAAATRPAHAKLNKLIISRLPLALPPRAVDPSLYASGILHIAPIYITFEALWQNILDNPPSLTSVKSFSDACSPEKPILDNESILQRDREGPQVHRALVCDRMYSMLQHLHLPGLMRSSRLKEDIKAMTGWPDHVIEEQLKIVGQTGRLAGFLGHMKRSVENRPHVLLSYSYIFFMALFAGGRFIRASLESVGNEFWDRVPSPIKPTMHACEQSKTSSDEGHNLESEGSHRSHVSDAMPLRFFHFPTPLDGEDLKREFKKRLFDSESMLTTRERHDIVQESICIFENMTLLVQQLDTVCGDAEQEEPNMRNLNRLLSLPRNMLAARLRDSVAVAKERRSARNSSRNSASSDESESSPIVKTLDDPKPPTAPTSPACPHRSQTFPRLSDITLCPAMSNKAVRFEKSPHPSRGPTPLYDGGIEELAGTLRATSKSVRGMRFVNWALVAALGVIILCALATCRTSMIQWPKYEQLPV